MIVRVVTITLLGFDSPLAGIGRKIWKKYSWKLNIDTLRKFTEEIASRYALEIHENSKSVGKKYIEDVILIEFAMKTFSFTAS